MVALQQWELSAIKIRGYGGEDGITVEDEET
jgi:hypothetical protein